MLLLSRLQTHGKRFTMKGKSRRNRRRRKSRDKSSRKSPSRRDSSELRTLPQEERFDLPGEILVEILSRLSVKSLLKFRCVSKSWLSLISCPLFIKTHTRVSMENSNLSGHRVIFACSYPQNDFKQCSVHSLLHEQSLTGALHVDYPIKYAPNHAWLGSSNGLICIFVDVKDLILWNPSTRKSKKLPSIGTNPKIYRQIIAYGFGFDEYKDDYNVVLIVRYFEEERGYKYSLRTDSWKRLGDIEDTGIPLSNSINFASGKLHWSTSPGTSSGFRWEIVCLDLESGVCGRLDQPDYGGSDIAYTLGVLGGCLCILCYEIDTHVDVWVLKEYGVKGSWTKLFRFPCTDHGGRFVFLKPLCMLPNGEILLIFGRSLVLCNPACGSFWVREATNVDRVDIYVETLVSPAVK